MRLSTTNDLPENSKRFLLANVNSFTRSRQVNDYFVKSTQKLTKSLKSRFFSLRHVCSWHWRWWCHEFFLLDTTWENWRSKNSTDASGPNFWRGCGLCQTLRIYEKFAWYRPSWWKISVLDLKFHRHFNFTKSCTGTCLCSNVSGKRLFFTQRPLRLTWHEFGFHRCFVVPCFK